MSDSAVRSPGKAWLRRYRPVPSPRLRLVCLPYAGGSAAAYREWAALLPHDVELLAVQYPGRQDRLAEPCVDDLSRMADLVTGALQGEFGCDVAVFGHSMGAAIAFEVALRLEILHGVQVAHVFVSANAAPNRRPTRQLHRAPDDELVAEMNRLGAADMWLLADEDIRQLVLPAFRSDLRLIETYRHRPGALLSAPMTVYAGAADADVEVDEVAAWREFTAGPSELRVFPGGHFFLHEETEDLVRDVVARLRSSRAV
ncbi:thioesterase II family protein [Micromonospora sp. NPDC047620]|uniref:thioesterase II family protein n=1 Tax=Micromonospora sp. NPDC047620 TaxID=3364251 RepID=UPI00371D05BC